jgi:hypothetical protein
MLRKMRMEEEALCSGEAADSVLRDNLFGLEIDPRCSQIATFAVALAAWKTEGHPESYPPKIACSGMPVKGGIEEWRRISNGDYGLTQIFETLYDLFKEAPTLGSLIDPKHEANRLGIFSPRWEHFERSFSRLPADEFEQQPFIVAADETLRAAALLCRNYTLVATNVPYLGEKKQAKSLREFCASRFPRAKADLATVFMERCISLCNEGGTVAIVTPQHWTTHGSSRKLRRHILEHSMLNVFAMLGSRAFDAIGGEVVSVALILLGPGLPGVNHQFIGLNASSAVTPDGKAADLKTGRLIYLGQLAQLSNPDARITLKANLDLPLLSSYANAYAGLATGDQPRVHRHFWELATLGADWEKLQETVPAPEFFGG